jgi:hypothetical protein
MLRQRSGEAWDLLFPKQPLDIHQPSGAGTSWEQLRRVRLGCLAVMSLVYGWQVAISRTVLLEVKFFSILGLSLSWLYFALLGLHLLLQEVSPRLRTKVGVAAR